MPWLRDFMRGAEPPISSFGKLSALALDCDEWPEESRPKARSLSTLFSKLDRGLDLDWLRDRTEVQLALANILGRPLGDIREAIGEVHHEVDERFLRLWDLRYARQIDLAKEDPPPGIPRLAWDPPSWNRSWWQAPSGSGRSITAQWLKSRGLAHTVFLRERKQLFELPPRGPVYIEVAPEVTQDDLHLDDEEMRALRFFERPVCFAAPFPPVHHAFQSFSSAQPLSYLPELVDWVSNHLDGRGHFSADRAHLWMKRVSLTANASATFGEVLGQLGMLDEVAPRTLSAKGLEEIAAHFVKARIRETSETQGQDPRLADEAFSALCECSARIYADSGSNLGSARDSSEWTALLSSSQAQNLPDEDWFTAALRGSLGSQVSKRDLRRAARKLPPQAFRLTRALKLAGILHPPSNPLEKPNEQALQLGPQWLTRVLLSHSKLFVTRLPASVWGRVLLSREDASDLSEALLAATSRGDLGAIFSLIDDDEEASIERDAAIEAAIIACGLASLGGGDVPDEIVEGLLELSGGSLLLIQGGPEASLVAEEASAGLYQREVFLLALLELIRRVPHPLPALDPFRSGSTRLIEHFDRAILDLLKRRHLPLPLRGNALRLMASLRSSSQDCADLSSPDCLGFIQGDKKAILLKALEQCPAEVLLQAIVRREFSEVQAFARIWHQLSADPDPGAFFESEDGASALWQHMSPSIFRERISAGLTIPYSRLLPHQYSDLLHHKQSKLLPAAGAQACPLDAAIILLEKEGPTAFSSEALPILVGRAGKRLAPYLVTLFLENQTKAFDAIVKVAPTSLSAALADSLPETRRLLAASGTTLESLRSYLLSAVRNRHPEFRKSHRLLGEIEQGVGGLKRLH